MFLCLALWSAHALSAQLDRDWVCMAVDAGPIDPVPPNMVLASRFLRFSLESAMTVNQHSFLVSKMCTEFMVCRYCECGQTTSSTELFVVKKAW